MLETNLENASSFARADLGWFALGEGFGPLELFRSTDGLSWTSVPVEIIEPPAVPDGWLVEYQNLLRVADGWAVTAFVRPEDMFGDPSPRTVHRFVSGDGVRWSTDPAFPPLQLANATWVPVHAADGVVVHIQRESTPSVFESALAEVVEVALTESPGFEVCRSDDRESFVRLHACGFDTIADVGPEQLREPDRYGDFRSCVGSLYAAASGNVDSMVSYHAVDGSIRNIESAWLGARPVVDGSGTLFTIEARPAGFAGSCDQWLPADGVEERQQVFGFSRWAAGASTPETIALPAGFESFRPARESALAPIPEGGAFYASDSELWRLGSDGSVTRKQTSLVIEGDGASVAFTPDGTRLLQFGSGVIEIHDLVADSTAELGYTPRSRGRFPIHVENDVAFVRSGPNAVELLVLR